MGPKPMKTWTGDQYQASFWTGWTFVTVLVVVAILQSRRPSFCPITEKPDTEIGEDSGKTAVVFSLKNEVGCLVKALRLFQVRNTHLDSVFSSSPPYLLHPYYSSSSLLYSSSFFSFNSSHSFFLFCSTFFSSSSSSVVTVLLRFSFSFHPSHFSFSPLSPPPPPAGEARELEPHWVPDVEASP